MTFKPSHAFPFLSALVVSVVLSACSSPETRREEFVAKVGPPQPPLVGKSTYFDGKVAVTAYLNPTVRPRPASTETGDGQGRERTRGRPPGGGMGGEGMYGEGGHRRGGGEGREMMGAGGPHPGGGPGGVTPPRQALTVTLTNTSNAPLNLQVVDVNSSLGNFVPVPEKATLAPGASMTLEPMRGALANLDELSLKLGLKGDGKAEQQMVTLKRVTAE